MADSKSIAPALISPSGEEIENAHIIRHCPDLYKYRQAAREVELQRRRKYPREKKRSQASYSLKEARATGILLELESQETQSLAVYLLDNEMIKPPAPEVCTPEEFEIPIICCPDGGIMTANGFKLGIDLFSDFKSSLHSAVKENGNADVIPDSAVDIAAKSGVLVITDSIIDTGCTIERIIKSFSEKYNCRYGKRTEPIKVIVASNVTYLDSKRHSHFDPESVNKPDSKFTIKAGDKILEWGKMCDNPPLDIHFYTNDVEKIRKDLKERGEPIAQLHHPSVKGHHLTMLESRTMAQKAPNLFTVYSGKN